jgi:hypothetical protein
VIRKILFALTALCLFCFNFPAAAQAAGNFTVIKNTAVVGFPNQITFNLGVKNSVNISDIRLRYSVEQESFVNVTVEAYINFNPSTSVDAKWTLDMKQIGGLPPGTTLHYWWIIRDVSGSTMETEASVVRFDDNRYSWKTVNSGLINIYWYNGDTAFANDLMATARQSLDKLAQSTGARIKNPIKIYVYGSTQDLLGALMYPYEWTGAVTYSQYGTIAIGLAPSNLDWGKAAVAHELTHLAIHQVTMNPYNDLPRWLDEGLAVYNEGVVDVSFSTALYNAVKSGTLISVRSLNSPFSADSNLASLSYGESFSIVDYLISNYGESKMLQLLTVFSQGSTYDDALMTVYGFDIAGLDSAWQKYARELYNPAKTTGVTA